MTSSLANPHTTFGAPYPKIEALRTRSPETNFLVPGTFRSIAVEDLSQSLWLFKEKMDGTNVRIHWDGYKAVYNGRTNNAQLHADLRAHLDSIVDHEELFEQYFGNTSATLYGEGVGPGIQKNGAEYGPEKHFVLFDVRTGHWGSESELVDVSDALNVPLAPFAYGHLDYMERQVAAGIDKRSPYRSPFQVRGQAEGVVATPVSGFLDRDGRRIVVKIKTKDYVGVNLGDNTFTE